MSAPVERTALHRYAHRAAYDRETIDAILDEGFVCHVGLHTDRGFPVVIPLAYGRHGDIVYLHGSAASRLFRGARATEVEICMTVTFVDGLVVARSTYNTDINYRSVVIIGKATEVKDLDEKRRGLDLMVDHIIPGRQPRRPPPDREGVAQHHAAADATGRILGEGAHRVAARRRGGLRPRHLGRCHPHVHDDRAGPRRPAPCGLTRQCPPTWRATAGRSEALSTAEVAV